jgi:hypothetical protein
MSEPLITPAGRGRQVRWPRSTDIAGLALAVACVLALPSGKVMAGPDAGADTVGATAPISSDAESDSELPLPLAFKPVVVKPLTAADLPPSNPLLAGVARTGSVAFGRDWRAGRDQYRALIERESLAFHLPPALLDAVMAVESHYNPAVIGGAGEIGLMQVMPATARMLGFAGTTAELAVPEINIHYGAQYLAGAWRLAGEDLCTATMKYRAGHGETRFSSLSVDYCMRVRNHLVASGVPVSGAVPQPNLGGRTLDPALNGPISGPAAGRHHGRSLSFGGTVNFAALNARLRTLSDRTMLRSSN